MHNHPNPRSRPRPRAASTDIVTTMAHYGSIAEFRAATPLPEDAQRVIDSTVTSVGTQDLTLMSNLLSRPNLVQPLPNWMSVLQYGYDSTGRGGRAKRSMHPPNVRRERFVLDRKRRTIPVFMTWDSFSFDARTLLAAERVGQPLDTTHIREAALNDNRMIEDQAVFGIEFAVDGDTAPGVLTDPPHLSNFKDNESWTAAGHSGEDIYDDVRTLIDAAYDLNKTGPFLLAMGHAYGSRLGDDYKANGDKTIGQRIREIEIGNGILETLIVPFFPDNAVALIQLTPDVVQVLFGQSPISVPWAIDPWETEFIVIACTILMVRQDIKGNTGIIVGTPDGTVTW
jgi:hypothetical protein